MQCVVFVFGHICHCRQAGWTSTWVRSCQVWLRRSSGRTTPPSLYNSSSKSSQPVSHKHSLCYKEVEQSYINDLKCWFICDSSWTSTRSFITVALYHSGSHHCLITWLLVSWSPVIIFLFLFSVWNFLDSKSWWCKQAFQAMAHLQYDFSGCYWPTTIESQSAGGCVYCVSVVWTPARINEANVV